MSLWHYLVGERHSSFVHDLVLVKTGQAQAWTFIGECYFQEFMDGKHVSRLMENGQPSEIFVLR